MPMTRRSIREDVRRFLGEPAPQEKTWENPQLNGYINDAFQEISNYGAIRGYADYTVTASGTTFPVPANLIRVTIATIGNTEYKMIHPGLWSHLRAAGNSASMVLADEVARTVTFPAEVLAGTVIRFIGELWHPEIDPDDESAVTDDNEYLILFDNRYKTAIRFYVLYQATLSTEDNYVKYLAEFEKALARLGFRFQIKGKFHYYWLEKRFTDHARY